MPDFHSLQPVIAPDFDRPRALYLGDPDCAPGCHGPLPWRLGAGEVVSTDTFLNAFFHDFWHTQAQIGRLGIHVVVDGLAVVEITAVDTEGRYTRLHAETVKGSEVVWIETVPDNTARVFLRLTIAETLTVSALCWVTDTPPPHQPKLSIGICTFNREPFVLRTLEALVGQIARTPEISAIWVVNQGTRFSDPRFREIAETFPVHLVEQRNLGGCGGFTRSMLECLEASPATTHHILMDDDIVLDPRMLDRVARFLSHGAQDVAFGGQMLEIERPTRLHEAGGRLHPLWYVESLGHGYEMDRPLGLRLFDRALDANYNAWWFCVLPTSVMRNVGLPPPLFIRGDDVEYGCRMREAGVLTRPLPGCVVWHESFAHKTSDWLLYYDLRNRLVLAALHPDLVKPPDALYLLGFVLSILFQHRYRATQVALRAIEDALSLPDVALGPDPAARHDALLEWLAQIPEPERLTEADLPETEAGTFRPLDPSVPAMVRMCVTGFVGQHLARLLPRRKPLRFSHLPQAPAVLLRDYVVASNTQASQYTLYRNDLRQMWTLLLRTFAVCLRHLRTSGRMAAIYRARLDEMRSTAYWRRVFGKTD